MTSTLHEITQRLQLHCEHGHNFLTLPDIQRWCDAAQAVIHLAILNEPYLSKIKTGEKTIESRLTKIRVAPFDRAKAADIVLFKRSGGPLEAIGEITRAEHIRLNAPDDLEQLVAQHADELGFEPGYTASKQAARYASLMWLGNVQPVADLAVAKRGQQAWLVFEPEQPETTLF